MDMPPDTNPPLSLKEIIEQRQQEAAQQPAKPPYNKAIRNGAVAGVAFMLLIGLILLVINWVE